MTDNGSRNYLPLAVGVGLVVFSTLGVLINRRPIGDIILMIVGGLAVLATAGYYLAQHRGQRQRAEIKRLRAIEEAARKYIDITSSFAPGTFTGDLARAELAAALDPVSQVRPS